MSNKNIWAPWRYKYLKSLGDSGTNSESKPCFLCRCWAEPQNDRQNLLLWRTKKCMVVFNRYPYTGGHLLIAPTQHVASLEKLDPQALQEMMLLARDGQKVLSQTIKPHGFNIGININRCAGAGLPDHIHMHLVPRWDGDTNFMDICGDIRVISQALDDLYEQLTNASRELSLPTIE